MKRLWTGSALLAVLLGGACRDGNPVGPGEASLSLQIESGTISFEERTIAVGQTVQLSATLRKPTGSTVQAGSLYWRSTDPGVAQVSTTGKVTGVSVGTTLLIAAANGAADTARINVAKQLTGSVSCSGKSHSLAVGEVLTTDAYDDPELCFEGGTTGAEYTFVPFNASDVSDASLSLRVASAGAIPVLGPPRPDLSRRALPMPMPLLRNDVGFHTALLEHSQRALEPRLREAVAQVPPAPRLAATPAVGDLLRLNVEVDAADGCSNPDYRTGRVVAVTERAVVIADTANPKGGFGDADYAAFGAAFDTLVWKVDTRAFGEPTDIDSNGHVLIFYTRAVNEQTPPNSDSYVGGYFYNRDLFSPTGTSACKGSNQAEMFYMLVPDPQGDVNGNVRSVSFVRSHTVSVLAHEFQHLINDSRRLYVNQAPVWEEVWLNEGLSHIAEELTFYEVAGLTPRRNLGPDDISTREEVTAFNQYQSDNISRLLRYLRDPAAASLMGGDELSTRGASWAFLRYAADRQAGDETSFWNALVRDARTSGLANLRHALGTEPRDWMRDWTLSVYTDDAEIGLTDERYTQPSWNFRKLVPSLQSDGSTIGNYPLATVDLGSSSTTTVDLQGGGGAFLRFGVPAAAQASLRATVSDLPGPSLLRFAIVRTK